MEKERSQRTYKKVGTFTLSQGKMLITDPCYDIDTWCMGAVDNCMTGKWTAAININHYKYESGTDNRVAAVFVRHESLPNSYAVFNHIHWNGEHIIYRDGWSLISENIGVDSGQAGFFDAAKYQDNSLFEEEGKCGFGDKWYSNCCDATLSKHAGIIADVGVNAPSGYGDGCYCAWKHEDKNGRVDAMVLFFLPDDDEVEGE